MLLLISDCAKWSLVATRRTRRPRGCPRLAVPNTALSFEAPLWLSSVVLFSLPCHDHPRTHGTTPHRASSSGLTRGGLWHQPNSVRVRFFRPARVDVRVSHLRVLADLASGWLYLLAGRRPL